MPEYRSFRLSCSCGKEFEAKLWESLRVAGQKELKAKLLSGEMNQVECSHCKKKSFIEMNFLYHDLEKKLWVQMVPQTERSQWQQLEEDYEKVIKKKSSIRKLNFRLVFGREELLEKIRIFDLSLDDRAIELLKLKIMAEDESLQNISDLKLIFIRHLPGEEELHFSLTSKEKDLSQTIVISSQHYNVILENKEHISFTSDLTKKVCSGIYVNVRKTRILH